MGEYDCIRCGHYAIAHIEPLRELTYMPFAEEKIKFVVGACQYSSCLCKDFAMDNLQYIEQEALARGL